MKIASIVGARPQFIKLAPLVRAIQKHNKSNSKLKIEHLIIHTGQHYDYEMNKIFFNELGIPEPDFNLEVGSGAQGWQTGEMIKKIEEVLVKEKPYWILVYGDTNTTLAGALAATKIHIRIAHIEAGLRSYNKIMPEETNRVLIDHCSDILFCPSEIAVKNMKKEGFKNIVNKGKLINEYSTKLLITNPKFPIVINVGDIMYDLFVISLEIAEKKSDILEKFKLKPKEYYLATIHRAENTDNKNRLRNIIEALAEISKEKPVILPVHPRTKKTFLALNISPSSFKQIHMIDPVGYLDILVLEKKAEKILTDSGGIQKEAYWLSVPCITLRDETEWVETVESGWNILAGTRKEKILEAINKLDKLKLRDKNQKQFFGKGMSAEMSINTLGSHERL